MNSTRLLWIAMVLGGVALGGYVATWAGVLAGDRFTFAVGCATTFAGGIAWAATRIVAWREGWDI